MAEPSRVDDTIANSPSGKAAALDWRARILAALDPLEGASSAADGSDHDLNPDIVVGLDGLQPAAVLIPVIERDAGLSVLLTRRADRMRRHAGQIAFPGGRSEAGETAAMAALREAQEEVGLDPAAVFVAGVSTPYRTITGYHITPVVGFLPPPNLALNPAEVADAFEVPLAFLMDPANHERRHRDQPPGPPRWHYAITWNDRVIWGATAGMIRALYERLGRADAG
jgi:8-oxo-dGTP pyrophosphatase MutT (NUDIX family)